MNFKTMFKTKSQQREVTNVGNVKSITTNIFHCFEYNFTTVLKSENILESLYPINCLGGGWRRLVGHYYIIDDNKNKTHLRLYDTKYFVINDGEEIFTGQWNCTTGHEGDGQIGRPFIHLEFGENLKYRLLFHKDNLLVLNKPSKPEGNILSRLLQSDATENRSCVYALRYNDEDIQNNFCELPTNHEEVTKYLNKLIEEHRINCTIALSLSYINLYLNLWMFVGIIAHTIFMFKISGKLAFYLNDVYDIGNMHLPIWCAFSLPFIICSYFMFNLFMSKAMSGYKAKCKLYRSNNKIIR